MDRDLKGRDLRKRKKGRSNKDRRAKPKVRGRVRAERRGGLWEKN